MNVFRVAFYACAVLGVGTIWSSASADAGKSSFQKIAKREAVRQGVPYELVDAVMFVESRYKKSARGAAGEVGLMQIMPPTARLLGFKGTRAQLEHPENNIRLGTNYLASAWRKGGKDICTAVMKYRAGHGESRFSVRSVEYCKKVRKRLRIAGYPVTGKVPKATFGFRSGGSSRGSRTNKCFARVVQPGPRYGQCIPLATLIKLGLVVKKKN
ncbi:MAG: lytic transglycosylase domain-containing protein [Hyphomicrobiales bacterium]